MYSFTSVHRKYRIFGIPINGEPEYDVQFEPIGRVGRFTTTDEKLAKKLREHRDFGKKFMELSVNAPENPNLIKGIRSSSTHPELGKEPFDSQKLIRFGELQATLLKKDGSYRKDATQDLIQEYETLKGELGQ